MGRCRRRGFTLVEVLLATAITLIMMAAVVTLFGYVGGRVADSRALLEMAERLRAARQRLQEDLAGVTAPMQPPLRPEQNKGYFEYVEGVVVEPFQANNLQNPTPLVSAPLVAVNTVRSTPVPDTSAGDFDDILMFTTRSQGEPFVGRFALPPPPQPGVQPNLTTIQSYVAEVAWFVRHNTLYRRVLLVEPSIEIPPDMLQQGGYYALYDISARQEGGSLDRTPGGPYPVRIVANSLGDLTKRENRYGHQPYAFPHDVRFWGRLGLPTLAECSAVDPAATPNGLWPFPLTEPPVPPSGSPPSWPNLPGNAYTVQSNLYPDPFSQLVVPGGLAVANDPTYMPPGNNTPRQVIDLVNTINNNGTLWQKPLDLWVDQPPWQEFTDPGITPPTPTRLLQTDRRYGFYALRVAEDVMLTNVLSFDVKAYDPQAVVLTDSQGQGVYHPGDPGYLQVFQQWIALPAAQRPAQVVSVGAYVDLNYLNDTGGLTPGTVPFSVFSGPGDPRSGLSMVYDTWSDHYERDGFNQNLNGLVDEGTDGVDNDGLVGVDDAMEREAPPPYAVPLRGIQVRIRVYEPSSRQIREVTLVQEFLPE